MSSQRIEVKKVDIAWNYIGTVFSMLSGFLLLPLLVRYLTEDELGLWYVFMAIANLAVLFEFGFNPTFARNIVYVLSGARSLSMEGIQRDQVVDEVDWHLLNVVIHSSRVVYALISIVVFILLASIGTIYVTYVSSGVVDGRTVAISWVIFGVSIVLNLYFLYTGTVLRGYGDIAGENKAKTIARLSQLLVSAIMLMTGFGLIGASLGYLVNSITLRILGIRRIKAHEEIECLRAQDGRRVAWCESVAIIKKMGHLAWRDGIVQLSTYISTQGMSIMSSLYLGLAETGSYSILLQFTMAIYNFACAYPRSFFPSMQAAYAVGDRRRQIRLSSSGLVAFWVLYLVATLGVALFILPVLPMLKPGVVADYPLFFSMAFYMALLQHHSIVCSYIIGMNEIPYMPGYLVGSVLGLIFVYILCGIWGLGAWGIIAGQAASQLIYNNWKWPVYFCKKLDTTFPMLMKQGISYWYKRIVDK